MSPSSDTSGCYGLSWTYDRYGNRPNQTATPGTVLSVPQPSHTVDAVSNHIVDPGFTVDANGNMLFDGLNTLSFDAANRLISASNGSGSAGYIYDGNGNRVEKVSGGNTTVYIYSGSAVIAEYPLGGSVSSPTEEYVYTGGKLIATLDSTIKYHLHDHLSVRITTDANGNIIGQQGVFPFGDSWYQTSGSTKWMFTDKERDAESGLDDFGARYYSSSLGRFLSVDPSGLSEHLQNPQTWNRYAYALNNPLDRVDRNGKWSTEVHNQIIEDAFRDTLSPNERQILKQASLYVDDFQGPAQSFMHGMRDGLAGQTPEQAQALGEKFISDQLAKAVKEQVDYEESGGVGNSSQALFDFGQALHTVADSESPWHDHYQNGWYGGTHWSDWKHVYNEDMHGGRREAEIGMAEHEARLLWTRYLADLKAERDKRKREAEKKKKEQEEAAKKQADGGGL